MVRSAFVYEKFSVTDNFFYFDQRFHDISESKNSFSMRIIFQKLYHILRRMDKVSAPGEAYNSRYVCGKVDIDMSSVGRPNLGSHVFNGFHSSRTRFGKDFRPTASLRAMFK